MRIHIGKQIQSDLQSQGRSVVWFAKQMCCSRQNCYRIFGQETPGLDVLRRASEILGVDYIAILTSSVNTIGTEVSTDC